MVQCKDLITTGGTPHLYNRGSNMQVNSCIVDQTICNFTNSVQISLIQTFNNLPFQEQYVGVDGKMFWWLIKKKTFLTGSLLSRLLSADIYISTGECGFQMPTLTEENSQLLQSGPPEVSLVMERAHTHARTHTHTHTKEHFSVLSLYHSWKRKSHD